jgi:hypothetical protein
MESFKTIDKRYDIRACACPHVCMYVYDVRMHVKYTYIHVQGYMSHEAYSYLQTHVLYYIYSCARIHVT